MGAEAAREAARGEQRVYQRRLAHQRAPPGASHLLLQGVVRCPGGAGSAGSGEG